MREQRSCALVPLHKDVVKERGSLKVNKELSHKQANKLAAKSPLHILNTHFTPFVSRLSLLAWLT